MEELMKLTNIEKMDPQVAQAIYQEMDRQKEKLELTPSENFVSPNVMEAWAPPTTSTPMGTPGKIITADASMLTW